VQLGCVLDEERIRHEGECGIGAPQPGKTALLRRIVDGRQTSRRPVGDRHCRLGELIEERLRWSRASKGELAACLSVSPTC